MNATVDRQMEILEQIHALKRELQELAGDTLVITIEPAKKNGKTSPGTSEPAPGARGQAPQPAEPAPPGEGTAAAAALAVLRESGDWMSVREIVEKTGKSRFSVSTACSKLVENGILEHNGRKTKAARVRIKPESLPGGASSERGLSPRTRKSIERAEAAATNGRAETVELEDLIREALALEASTLRELSEKLDVEIPEIAKAVSNLRERGAVIGCGKRMPRRDQVYGIAGAE